jgi:phosphoserine phosphatase RsbU/P
MREHSSITTRLIALLTLCAALIIGLGMLVDYRLSRDQILNRLQLESQETIRAVVIDMENWLDAVEGSTSFLARILQQRDYTPAGLKQMLKDIVENNPDIFGAAIALNPGRAASPLGFAPYYFRRDGILTYADLAGEQYNYQQQAWYRDTVAAGTPQWIEPYHDRGGGEILMTTFAVPVYRVDDSGKRFLYAVVTADVALAELHAYLQRLRLGENGFGILLSRAGIILSSPAPEDIMRHYSTIATGTVGIRHWEDMFHSALKGQLVTRQVACPDTPGQCVIRLGSLQSTGWPVGVIYSEREMLAPLRQYQLKSATTGVLTLLLMVLAVGIISRRLTRPLTALAGASDEVAQGELNAPLPRPRGNDEVARLIRSFASMQKSLKSYIAELKTATASRARLEGELGAARSIQMSMLPQGGEASEQEPDYALWARVRPAKSVGGDLYSYYRKGNALFIAVGDVSDKGVAAALFMARTISLIQQMAPALTSARASQGVSTAGDSSPGTAMATLNDALTSGNDNCMFVTLFLGVLDLDSLELHFASAGHTPPSLLRAGEILPLQQQDGPALGLATNLDFPENVLQLQAGDRLAIFTDGIDEAFNEHHAMYGIERFNRELAAGAMHSVAVAGTALFQAVDDFAGATPQSDDITLMLLEIPPTAAETGTGLSAASQHFTRGPRLVSRSLEWLQQQLEQSPTALPVAGELMLVTEEIVANIDKYAQLAEDAAIQLTVEFDPTGIVLQVTDTGIAFNPLEQSERSALGTGIETAAIGGLGVHLITTLSDRQSYRREGGCNILRVTKLLEN